MDTKITMERSVNRLPANQAFVVQFGGDGSGRVEHVLTGKNFGFTSWKDLQEWVDGVLRGVKRDQ